MATLSPDDLKEALKQQVNHCKQALGEVDGCADEELDTHGYCRHLVGFTNDDKTFEPVQHLKLPTGELVGVPRVMGGRLVEQVQPGDVVFNPTKPPQIVDGAIETPKKWVSARVYRKDAQLQTVQIREHPKREPKKELDLDLVAMVLKQGEQIEELKKQLDRKKAS